MNPKPFDHRFTNGIEQCNEITGYVRCLTHVFNHLSEVTKWKPENRYIDACDLLDRITATNEEIRKLSQQAEGTLILHNIKPEDDGNA